MEGLRPLGSHKQELEVKIMLKQNYTGTPKS